MLSSRWDYLPLEIKNLILEEKKRLELEEHRKNFLPTLREILEYTFGMRWRYSKLYRNRFFQMWDITTYGHEHRKSGLTCITCKKPIFEAVNSSLYSYTSHIYHTLDGKYDCCYYMDSLLAMHRKEIPIPKVLPIKPESYLNIFYFPQFKAKINAPDEGLEDFLATLDDIKYKYKYLRSVSLDSLP